MRLGIYIIILPPIGTNLHALACMCLPAVPRRAALSYVDVRVILRKRVGAARVRQRQHMYPAEEATSETWNPSERAIWDGLPSSPYVYAGARRQFQATDGSWSGSPRSPWSPGMSADCTTDADFTGFKEGMLCSEHDYACRTNAGAASAKRCITCMTGAQVNHSWRHCIGGEAIKCTPNDINVLHAGGNRDVLTDVVPPAVPPAAPYGRGPGGYRRQHVVVTMSALRRASSRLPPPASCLLWRTS